jgi:hypothetical protein
MIPPIIHQLWIGTKPCPHTMMNTWREKNKNFKYMFWNEAAIQENLSLECLREIHLIQEINGKADIIRWEILYKYGGIFIDADSICIEPLDPFFLEKSAFATFENEELREGLVATGTMGFRPNHPLCRDIIQWIQTPVAHETIQKFRAWYSVGPGLLTHMLNTGNYPDFSVFPSFMFLPMHFTGNTYKGHRKVYAYQEWGTAKGNYDVMNTIALPASFLRPTEWVSILISSYNTDAFYIKECLSSIKDQQGFFGMEIVWINDGSTLENTLSLKELLAHFRETSRWTQVLYREHAQNRGTRETLRDGVLLCSHELIFKMDSDDIMLPFRVQKQCDFMRENPESAICGSNMILFKNREKEKEYVSHTNHPCRLTWEDFQHSPSDWFMNHPTLCYRKSAVLQVGNYKLNDDSPSMREDYDLEVCLLRHFKKIENLQENLLYYRIHPHQLTQQQKPTEQKPTVSAPSLFFLERY